MDPRLIPLSEMFVALLNEGSDVYELKSKGLKRYPDYPSELIVSAIEIAEGRMNARKQGLGEWVSQGFFTKVALQQATHPSVSLHHASRFQGCSHLLEICTGLGFDTAALAGAAKHVTTIEADPSVAEYARHNLSVQGVNNVTVVCADAETYVNSVDITQFDGLWADPSRRVGERRTRDPKEYQPSLDWIQSLDIKGPRGIKISPAINIEEIPNGWSQEWIGFQRECKEQLLWHGVPVISNQVSIVDCQYSWSPQDSIDPFDLVEPLPETSPYYLVEPHSAIIRSGGVAELYKENTISLMAEAVAYGISVEKPVSNPLYESFEVFKAGKFSRKNLLQEMKGLEWDSRTEIKKRGVPDEPDELRKLLKLPKPTSSSDGFGVILLARIGKDQVMFFAKRVLS